LFFGSSLLKFSPKQPIFSAFFIQSLLVETGGLWQTISELWIGWGLSLVLEAILRQAEEILQII